MKHLSRDSGSPGRDTNPGPLEYELKCAKNSVKSFDVRDRSMLST